MRRREALIFFSGLMSMLAGATQARAADLPRIGILDPGLAGLFDAFFAGMRELGYVDRQSVVYLRRSAAGRADAAAQLAAELAAARVDAIVTAGSSPVLAAMKAAPTIPIVFAALGDAIRTGATTNLAHPDRNATGMSFLNTELDAKRFGMLHELLPGARRITVLFDRNSNRASLEAALDAARVLGLEAPVMEVASRDDFAAGFEAAQKAGAQAINVLASPFFNANRDGLIDLAARHRLPAMYESGEYVRDGGLISYGPDFADLFRRAAGYVDRLLKRAKPADLPIEQPTKFELLINAKTAKALGVSVPPLLLAQADEIIE